MFTARIRFPLYESSDPNVYSSCQSEPTSLEKNTVVCKLSPFYVSKLEIPLPRVGNTCESFLTLQTRPGA